MNQKYSPKGVATFFWLIAPILFADASVAASQQYINETYGIPASRLYDGARYAGDVVAIRKNCRSAKLSTGGKALMGLLPILYEVQEKNQKPNPPRFKKAIRIYEDRYIKAMKRFNRAATNTALKNLCSQETSKYGSFFR